MRQVVKGCWGALAMLLAISVAVGALLWRPGRIAAATDPVRPVAGLADPDRACAACHARIYDSYKRTAMGSGSGDALAGLFPGGFVHEASGVQYKVFKQDGGAWMRFSREAGQGAAALEGRRALLYYVGSGRRGRTYLYEQEGEWFELPVNWYTRRGRWGMAPAYEDASSMPAPLPVDANCLHCHASAVEQPVAEAPNRFPQRPFDQGGVGCGACHGDPAQHLAAQGHGPILNPAKFGVAARDSACVQCHLEGDAVVYQPGRSLAQFQPGDRLSDFAVYFVRASQTGGGQRASSQYEALLRSACKRGAGDQLTCTTCHDPHSEPSAVERVAFYRAKCLGCHVSPALATRHHPEQPDCASCHMPTRRTADISHEQVTDHDVERTPAQGSPGGRSWQPGETLVPVGLDRVDDRALGLAYAQRAQKGDGVAAQRALTLLRQAEATGSDDVLLHVNLGWLEQSAGEFANARREYGATLRAAPFNASALTNRAVLDAKGGELAEAVRLLDRLVRADPSQTLAGVDLIRLECQAGETERAAALRNTLRDLNPDAPALKEAACGKTQGPSR